jgi:hypothetical protein
LEWGVIFEGVFAECQDVGDLVRVDGVEDGVWVCDDGIPVGIDHGEETAADESEGGGAGGFPFEHESADGDAFHHFEDDLFLGEAVRALACRGSALV